AISYVDGTLTITGSATPPAAPTPVVQIPSIDPARNTSVENLSTDPGLTYTAIDGSDGSDGSAQGQDGSAQTERLSASSSGGAASDVDPAASLRLVVVGGGVNNPGLTLDDLGVVAEMAAPETLAAVPTAMALPDTQEPVATLQAPVLPLSAAVLDMPGLAPQQTSRGLVLTAGSDLLFDFDKDKLKPAAKPIMRKLAEFLKNHPEQSMIVEGHTDSIGHGDYNLGLSKRRALAVKTALVKLGVNPAELSTEGYGATQPVASNATLSGRKLNRRVDFVLPGITGGIDLTSPGE
ncbi:MAG TPA: OmpA family protein, partial [Gammaproteobacteria bacterium]